MLRSGCSRAIGTPRGVVALVGVTVAAVLLTLTSAIPLGAAEPRHPAAVSQGPPVVNAFFELVVWRAGSRKTLTRLRVLGVPGGQHVISACAVCGKTRFSATIGVDRVVLRASPSLRMKRSTRVIVGVISPGSIGRWIVIGFQGNQYKGLHHGCMTSQVTSLSPAEAADPSTIPSASCAGPCLSCPGTEYVMWRGTDHQLWGVQYGGQSTNTSLPVGSGRIGSPPSVVVRDGGERDVFWRGSDHHLEEMWYTGFWNGPIELSSAGRLHSDPTAMVDAEGVDHVFWKGTNGWLWELSNPGRVWSTRVPLDSGPVGSPPATVAHADGSQDLFWKGTKGRLWEMQYTNTWHSAFPLPSAGKVGSTPTALTDAQGVDHVFWRGTNGYLWELSGQGHSWTASVPLNSGRLGSAPAAVVRPDGEQDVFWKGRDRRLRELVHRPGRGWGNPMRLKKAGKLGSRPTAATGR